MRKRRCGTTTVGRGVGVGSGRGVAVGVGEGADVAVGIGVGVAGTFVAPGRSVAVGAGVGVTVGNGVGVADGCEVAVGTGVGVAVGGGSSGGWSSLSTLAPPATGWEATATPMTVPARAVPATTSQRAGHLLLGVISPLAGQQHRYSASPVTP